jgi:hypothetical protein
MLEEIGLFFGLLGVTLVISMGCTICSCYRGREIQKLNKVYTDSNYSVL